MRFGAPRRIAQGLDANRLAMLLAVINRHAGLALQEHDVFVNVVGGIQISETAWDLPVIVALASQAQGFKVALIPRDNAPRKPPPGLTLHAVSTVAEALAAAFAGRAS